MTSTLKVSTIGGFLSEKTPLLHQLVNGEIPKKDEKFKQSTKTIKQPDHVYEITFMEPLSFHDKDQKFSALETTNLLLYVFNVYYDNVSDIAENILDLRNKLYDVPIILVATGIERRVSKALEVAKKLSVQGYFEIDTKNKKGFSDLFSKSIDITMKHGELKKSMIRKSGIFKKHAKGYIINELDFLTGPEIYPEEEIKAVVDDCLLLNHPLLQYIKELSNKLDQEIVERKTLQYLVFELQQKVDIQQETIEQLKSGQGSPNSSGSNIAAEKTVISPKYQNTKFKMNEINFKRASAKNKQSPHSPRSHDNGNENGEEFGMKMKILPRSFSDDKKRTSERAMKLPISFKNHSTGSMMMTSDSGPEPERRKTLTEQDLVDIGKKVDMVATKRQQPGHKRRTSITLGQQPNPVPSGTFKVKKNIKLEDFIHQKEEEQQKQVNKKNEQTNQSSPSPTQKFAHSRKRSWSLTTAQEIELLQKIDCTQEDFEEEIVEEFGCKFVNVEFIIRNEISSPRSKNKIKVVLTPSTSRNIPILRDQLKPSQLMAKIKRKK
eukprot:gene4051-7340_t